MIVESYPPLQLNWKWLTVMHLLRWRLLREFVTTRRVHQTRWVSDKVKPTDQNIAEVPTTEQYPTSFSFVGHDLHILALVHRSEG